MIEKTLVVQNRQGIHARPAGMIVEITSRSNSEVTFKYQEYSANAKSILNVMMLAVIPGAEVFVSVEGDDVGDRRVEPLLRAGDQWRGAVVGER